MKKFTRATLKSLVKKGLVEVRVRSNYTDDYAYDAEVNFGRTDWKSASYVPGNRRGHDITAEAIVFDDDYFSMKGGRASREGDLMHLSIWHFLYFDFRLKAA